MNMGRNTVIGQSSNTGAELLRGKGRRQGMGGGIKRGISTIKEENCSLSEGRVVSSGGTEGVNGGCTGAEGVGGITGKGSSSLSW